MSQSQVVEQKPAEDKQPEHNHHEHPVRIENWEVCPDCFGKPWPHLHGNCYGHPHLPDGEYVRTSQLLHKTGTVAVCKSRVWHLGKAKG